MSRQPNAIINLINQLHDQLPDRAQLGDPAVDQRVLDLVRQRVELEQALELSDATRKRYSGVGGRFLRLEGGVNLTKLCETDQSAGEIIEQFVSKTNTAGVFRGAIRHTIATRIFLTVLGNLAHGKLSIEKAASYSRCLFEGLRKVEPLPRNGGSTPWFVGDGHGRKQLASKRGDLPSDQAWRKKLWLYVARNGSRYKTALAVLDHTGARPDELVTGIDVSWIPSDQHGSVLMFEIATAKRADGAIRTLITKVGAEDGAGRFLADQIRLAGEPIRVSLEPMAKTTLSGRIRTWGKSFGWSVSSYSYRHAMGDDLRSRRDPRLLAIALGHKTTGSQRHYGATSGGRGGRRRARDLLIDATTNIEPIVLERQFDKMGASQDVGQELEVSEDLDDLVPDPVD